MVKEIEQAVLGNLDWLVTRFKSLAVKLIGFVFTCWLVIGAIWTGLVLPVSLVKGQMVHGHEAKVIVAKEVLRKQSDDYLVNRVPNRVHDQAPMVVRNNAAQPVARNEIRNATNTINELRYFTNGIESLVKQ